jgi:hypothetical protein
VLRKANGTIDISSALTALKAALFFDGVVMFRILHWDRVKIPGGLSGILGAVSDLAHTSCCVRCRAAAMSTSSPMTAASHGHLAEGKPASVRSRCAAHGCAIAPNRVVEAVGVRRTVALTQIWCKSDRADQASLEEINLRAAVQGGREKRPGFDRLCKAIIRREIDMVAAWSVDKLGRSLQDLVAFLAELQASRCELYLHQQGLDTSTPAGRALFGTLSVFADFERAMIVERTKADLAGVRAAREPDRTPK